MKTLVLLPALVVALMLTQCSRVAAQTCTVLHTFSLFNNSNVDGSGLAGGVILSGGILYGAAIGGGAAHNGTLFALETNGANFTVVYGFTNIALGSSPDSRLFFMSNFLYGTAGTLFGFNTTNLTYTNLHTFAPGEVDIFNIGPYQIVTNSDGVGPDSGMVGTNGVLYGVTETGGSNATGTLYKLNPGIPSLTSLHIFSPLTSGTNADGATPWGGVVLAGNMVCGTASIGGTNGLGTVFGYNTNTGVFTVLHTFSAISNTAPYGNSDGAEPWATLTASGNTLFGTTLYGGTAGNGTVFALNTITGSFTNLHSFTNGDGSGAYGGLVVSNNTLFGTTESGGANGSGTVYKVNTDASGYAIVYNFSALVYSSVLNVYTNADGAEPNSPLTLSGNTLYGTGYGGGTNGNGVVFSLAPNPGPTLAMIRSGTNVVISWPTNATGFTLQSITNLSSTSWSTVSPAAVVVGGQYTVTNGITGRQMFYRLSE